MFLALIAAEPVGGRVDMHRIDSLRRRMSAECETADDRQSSEHGRFLVFEDGNHVFR